MKHKIKYLGIGLFIASLCFSLGERSELPFIESTNNSSAKHYEEEIASLNKTIATLKDDVKLLENENNDSSNIHGNSAETDSTDLSSDISSTAADSSNSTAAVVTGSIYIYESVTLYDIGRQAEDLNIIDNGRELELYLAKPEYSRSIQKGVFQLNSDMTLEEMAKILTGKKLRQN